MNDEIDPKIKALFPWALFLVLAALFAFAATRVHASALETMCAPLKKFERSCVGVKAAAATLGKTHAEWLARKCGATDHDIQEARDCLLPDVCGGQTVDNQTYTSHPECRR